MMVRSKSDYLRRLYHVFQGKFGVILFIFDGKFETNIRDCKSFLYSSSLSALVLYLVFEVKVQARCDECNLVVHTKMEGFIGIWDHLDGW